MDLTLALTRTPLQVSACQAGGRRRRLATSGWPSPPRSRSRRRGPAPAPRSRDFTAARRLTPAAARLTACSGQLGRPVAPRFCSYTTRRASRPGFCRRCAPAARRWPCLRRKRRQWRRLPLASPGTASQELLPHPRGRRPLRPSTSAVWCAPIAVQAVINFSMLVQATSKHHALYAS